jgi:NADH-quinone oxidoreductase subunit M
LGIFQENTTIGFLSAFGVILSACYSIWLYNRVVFRNVKLNFLFKFRDLKKTERFIFYPLLFFVFLMGIYPKFFLDLTYLPVLRIVLL